MQRILEFNRYMYIICQLAHSANSAHALAVTAWHTYSTWFFALSAADVIQTRAKLECVVH